MSMSRGVIAACTVFGFTCLAVAQDPGLVAPSSPGDVPPPSGNPVETSPVEPGLPIPTHQPGLVPPSQPMAIPVPTASTPTQQLDPPPGYRQNLNQHPGNPAPVQQTLDHVLDGIQYNYPENPIQWSGSTDYPDMSAGSGSMIANPVPENFGTSYHGETLNAGAHLTLQPPLGLIAPEGGTAGSHVRFPYYSYRRPWYYPGPASQNVTIVW